MVGLLLMEEFWWLFYSCGGIRREMVDGREICYVSFFSNKITDAHCCTIDLCLLLAYLWCCSVSYCNSIYLCLVMMEMALMCFVFSTVSEIAIRTVASAGALSSRGSQVSSCSNATRMRETNPICARKKMSMTMTYSLQAQVVWHTRVELSNINVTCYLRVCNLILSVRENT